MRIAWSGAHWRRRLSRLCVALGVAAIVGAATQPFAEVGPTGDEGILELVIDASGSMQSDDVVPTRLGATQQAVLRLVDRLPARLAVGLVSFSTFPETKALPTTDHEAIRRRIATLMASGSTAVDQGLGLALQDIQASHPATPASILLISDGTNLMSGDPVAVARVAAARHVKIMAVAIGRPDSTVTVRDEAGVLQRIPIPPDVFTLSKVAETTGGHAVAARSVAELETAIDHVVVSSGLDGAGREDLTLLFVAVAAVLFALGRTLAPRQSASDPKDRRRRPRGRWTWAVALVLAAAMVTVAWTQWRSGAASAASARSAMLAKLAAQPAPAPLPPPPAPPFVAVSGSKADRTIVQQAARLLRAHGALAAQRTREIRRRHLNAIGGIEVSACDVCQDATLASSNVSTFSTNNGPPVCGMTLNTAFARRQAARAGVPVRMLVAMAILHQQEACLHARVPFASEQRLAERLHNPLLLDLLYAQIEARRSDWNAVEQAVATLRNHGELGFQRRDDLKRRHLNQVGPLWITVCRGCLDDLLGYATTGSESGGVTGCGVQLDMTGLERDARNWGLPTTFVIASTLVHEQEHCIRDPDDRETPSIDEERRLALRVGSARLLEYAVISYQDLDSTGHWKS